MEFVGTREDLEGLDTCGRYHRGDRVREEIGTATLTQEVDDLFLTRCETADRTAEGFTERAGDDLYLTAHVVELGHTVSGLTDNSGRVRFVHHDEGIVFLCEFVDLIQGADITVHGEDTIGSDDTETLCLCFLELLLEVRHVAVGVAVTHGFAETDAVDDGRMVEGVGDDSIFFG